MAEPATALPSEVDVLVVGAGQAGLGAAYWLLREPGLRVLVLDRAAIGDSWRQRWDSLVLFTPRRFSGLPGLRFPAGTTRTPTKTEMAEYLTRYAERFALPVRTGIAVTRLRRDDDRYVAETTAGAVRARHVVLATGPFHRRYVPAVATDLDPRVHQMHSYDYRSPDDVPAGDVLVVGGGNSAAQLAVELARTHTVTVAAPRPPWFLPVSLLGVDLYWWTYLTGMLNADHDSRTSRYVRGRGDAIVGRQLRQLVREGTVRLLEQRVVATRDTHVVLADGTEVPVSSVLWCTGFRPDMSCIDVPGALDAAGQPVHDRGASPVPGLHWMGLPWQTRLNSSIINGVDRDARALAQRIHNADRRPEPG